MALKNFCDLRMTSNYCTIEKEMRKEDAESMVQIDISNVWSGISLPDLLELEQEVSAAHSSVADAGVLPIMENTEPVDRMLSAARNIRSHSDVVVVVTQKASAACTQGVMELLQGVYRNYALPKGIPQVIFAGESFSARYRNELGRLLEGRDFSLILADTDELEGALASRTLRWMLERRYGAEGARGRIYAAAARGSALHTAACAQGWEVFERETFLGADVLLPLAVAGVDIRAMLDGARGGKETLDLRSFENPMWLYTAVRTLLYRRGRTTEIIGSFEPCFGSLGLWWRLIFGRAGGAFPVCMELPSQLHGCEPILLGGRQNCFETVVNFAPPKNSGFIVSDLQDWDGLNYLAGRDLNEVLEKSSAAFVDSLTDVGAGVMCLNFGERSAAGAGEILYFLALSSAVCVEILEKETGNRTESGRYQDELFRSLGKPDLQD